MASGPKIEIRLFEGPGRADIQLNDDRVEGLHFVNPTETITHSAGFIRGSGTYAGTHHAVSSSSKKQADGGPLTTSQLLAAPGALAGARSGPGNIFASLLGIVEVTSRLVCVRPFKTRYVGEVGDLVVGRVDSIGNTAWKIDVRSQKLASLSFSAINLPGNVLRKRTVEDLSYFQGRAFLCEHQLIAAEVQSILSDGSLALHRLKVVGEGLSGSLALGFCIDLREAYFMQMLPDNPDFIRRLGATHLASLKRSTVKKTEQDISEMDDKQLEESLAQMEDNDEEEEDDRMPLLPPSLYGSLIPKQTNHVISMPVYDLTAPLDAASMHNEGAAAPYLIDQLQISVILGMNAHIWLGCPSLASTSSTGANDGNAGDAKNAKDHERESAYLSMALLNKMIGTMVINRIPIYGFLLAETYKHFVQAYYDQDQAPENGILGFYDASDKTEFIKTAIRRINEWLTSPAHSTPFL